MRIEAFIFTTKWKVVSESPSRLQSLDYISGTQQWATMGRCTDNSVSCT